MSYCLPQHTPSTTLFHTFPPPKKFSTYVVVLLKFYSSFLCIEGHPPAPSFPYPPLLLPPFSPFSPFSPIFLFPLYSFLFFSLLYSLLLLHPSPSSSLPSLFTPFPFPPPPHLPPIGQNTLSLTHFPPSSLPLPSSHLVGSPQERKRKRKEKEKEYLPSKIK